MLKRRTEDHQNHFFNKNKIKEYQHEDINKNFIRELNKLDTSYNPASLNYINEKFKDIILEDTPE